MRNGAARPSTTSRAYAQAEAGTLPLVALIVPSLDPMVVGQFARVPPRCVPLGEGSQGNRPAISDASPKGTQRGGTLARNDPLPISSLSSTSAWPSEQAGRTQQQHDGHDDEHHDVGGRRIEELGEPLDQP